LPRKFFIKKYDKNRSFALLNYFVPPKPLDLGYRSGLSERSKGKQRQTVESDELSTYANM